METRALRSRSNAYVQDAALWATLRTNQPWTALTMRVALGLVELWATVAWPRDVEGLILSGRRSGSTTLPMSAPGSMPVSWTSGLRESV